MLNVVCVKWGAWCHPFGAEYVNVLARTLRANLSLPYRLICFTDDPNGIDRSVEVADLPGNLTGWWWENVYTHKRLRKYRSLLSLPYLLQRNRDERKHIADDRYLTRHPIDLRGWYNKLFLFKPGVLSGKSLFMDLDTVIVGNIDEIAAYNGDFCILRGFRHNTHYGSGLIHFDPAATGHIWSNFVKQGCPVFKLGDQEFIELMMPNADFFQDRLPGQVVSYKVHCSKRGVPSYARIVCFHGSPRPHEVNFLRHELECRHGECGVNRSPGWA